MCKDAPRPLTTNRGLLQKEDFDADVPDIYYSQMTGTFVNF